MEYFLTLSIVVRQAAVDFWPCEVGSLEYTIVPHVVITTPFLGRGGPSCERVKHVGDISKFYKNRVFHMSRDGRR